MEKNYELPPEHPSRKFKGRVVFQGNRVVNQNWEAAVFQDLGSAPATMDASRAADCFGASPGYCTEIADAEQAYIQAELRGTPCWICLPEDERPASWAKDPRISKMWRPVVPLKKALYGHPDSGTCWEEHCDAEVKKVGFTPVGAEWPSTYVNKKLDLFLVIYVDDFKLLGPKSQYNRGLALATQGLDY